MKLSDKLRGNGKELWCIIANIKKEIPYGPGGHELKRGLKKFKAGAKIHIIDLWLTGMNEAIVVIGQHRNSGKYIACTIPVTTVENFRIKRIYSESILQLPEKAKGYNHGGKAYCIKEEAEKALSSMMYWIKDIAERKAENKIQTLKYAKNPHHLSGEKNTLEQRSLRWRLARNTRITPKLQGIARPMDGRRSD